MIDMRERNRQIVSARTEERLTLKAIAARFGITWQRVQQILRRHGVDTSPIPSSEEEWAERQQEQHERALAYQRRYHVALRQSPAYQSPEAREKRNAYYRQYRAEHHEEINARVRARYAESEDVRQRQREKNRKWREKPGNREKSLAAMREYAKRRRHE